MGHEDTVKENFEDVNDKFEYDLQMKKLKEEIIRKFAEYRTTMRYMAADAPIAILCLPSSTEKTLADQGLLRIYDLFDLDLVKIEGLSVAKLRDLTTRLNQFFSML